MLVSIPESKSAVSVSKAVSFPLRAYGRCYREGGAENELQDHFLTTAAVKNNKFLHPCSWLNSPFPSGKSSLGFFGDNEKRWEKTPRFNSHLSGQRFRSTP